MSQVVIVLQLILLEHDLRASALRVVAKANRYTADTPSAWRPFPAHALITKN
jgi:hypothetical protein